MLPCLFPHFFRISVNFPGKPSVYDTELKHVDHLFSSFLLIYFSEAYQPICWTKPKLMCLKLVSSFLLGLWAWNTLNKCICIWLRQIAEDYAHCEFLIRLPGYCPSMWILLLNNCLTLSICSTGLVFKVINMICGISIFVVPAFRDLVDVPLVVRKLQKSPNEVFSWETLMEIFQQMIWVPIYNLVIFLMKVRKELGIEDNVKIVIFNFGGQVLIYIPFFGDQNIIVLLRLHDKIYSVSLKVHPLVLLDCTHVMYLKFVWPLDFHHSIYLTYIVVWSAYITFIANIKRWILLCLGSYLIFFQSFHYYSLYWPSSMCYDVSSHRNLLIINRS